MAEVGVRAIGKFDARVRASELPSTGDPRDSRALVKEIHWIEILHSLFHYQLHSQHLPFVVVRYQLRRQHLDYRIRVLLLWIYKTKW